MSTQAWLIIIAVVLSSVIGGLVTHYTFDKPQVITNTVTVLKDTSKTKVILKIVPVDKEKKASLKQLDSLFQAALDYWMQSVPYVHDTLKQQFGNFRAVFDTSLVSKDSSTTIVTHNEVGSRLPLDLQLKFYNEYLITQKPKIVNVPASENSFGFVRSLTLGPGYDVIHKKFGITITLGYGFKF